MSGYLILEFGYLFYAVFLIGDAASRSHQNAPFSVSSIMDAALPVIHPLVAAGSNKCEALKSFFGLTYEQMQVKNSTNFYEELNIDWITKDGNRKYNLTATRHAKKLMEPATEVIILIHGFMESSDGLMVQALAPELLKIPGLRLFALDGRRVINLEYFRSSTYARFMGELLGMFLSEVINKCQDSSKITLIGHSLGAHIAAVAAKTAHRLTGKLLGRIIALDPAGPCFSNIHPSGRINRSDAEYVDVIHTNGGILGLKEPEAIMYGSECLDTAYKYTSALFIGNPCGKAFVKGHKDFYPNGGSSQPGCFLSTCDHSRAWELLAESVNAPKHFPARKCGNWTMFTKGLCSKNEISYMGMHSGGGSQGLYFLSTASSSPFGLGAAGSG